MCAGKHASLGIRVRGNNKLGETRIPATPALIQHTIDTISLAIACKWERNEASLNPAIYLRCFTSNGVSIIGVFIEKPCLKCRVPLLPF